MKVSALHKNARIAPRKVRPLGGVIVGLPAERALEQLNWQADKASQLVKDVLSSAIANAEHNYEITKDNLQVSALNVDKGFRFKRFQPVSRGSGHAFVKQTSHIAVELEEIKESKDSDRPKKKTEIETVELEEFAKSQEITEDVSNETHEKKTTNERAEEKNVDASSEATGKIKSNQRGGESQKTHRRKSM